MPLRAACGLPVTVEDEDEVAKRTNVCGQCFHLNDVAHDAVLGYQAALEAVCADILARKSEPLVTYMRVPHPSLWDLRAAPEPKPTKRRVSAAGALWQKEQDEAAKAALERNTGDVRLSFTEGAPGRFLDVPVCDEAGYNDVMFGICKPIVARVLRDDPNGPREPILRRVEEEIYLKPGEELGKPLVELLANPGGLTTREVAREFDRLMKARERVLFVLDMEGCINTGGETVTSPRWGWITKRVWVAEDSRAAAMLRELIASAKAKAKAEAALESPVGGYSSCSPKCACRDSPKHKAASPHYEPSHPGYSATSPGYNPRAPCYSATSPNYSPAAPCYSPNSPHQEPNSPMS